MTQKKYPFEWPKPSVTPYLTITYIIINICLTYAFFYARWDIGWLLPSWLMNVFFMWAERVDYLREKRLFDSWLAEMERIFGDDRKVDRVESWKASVDSVRRVRKSIKKKKTGEPTVLWRAGK